MDFCKLADAPRFTVLRRRKDLAHECNRFVFWGGAFIPGRVEQIPHAVCFDLFGSPVHIRLTEWVVPNETSKTYQDRMREWYWGMTLYEPVHWMKVKREETNVLKLHFQAKKAMSTKGLIRVARKRVA